MCNKETIVTLVNSVTLTGKKQRYWIIYHKRERKLLFMILSNSAVILGLCANLFSVTWELQKCFQVITECESLILNKNATKICFGEKISKTREDGFYVTNNIFQTPRKTALMLSKINKREGKEITNLEGTAVKRQCKQIPKKYKNCIHVHNVHANTRYSGEDRMWETINHLR